MSAPKSMPMTKEEVMQLVNLVHVNPIILSKATNASNNQLKDETWVTITDYFNSIVASSPRRPEQLRLKWENLKKAARKRSIRMNNIKTGSGKPDFFPPDEVLDKVASILEPNEPVDVPSAPLSSPHAPKTKFVFSSVASKGKLKRQATTDELELSIKDRDRAIADYYMSKRKREEEIHQLKKRKLEMELEQLEKRFCGSM